MKYYQVSVPRCILLLSVLLLCLSTIISPVYALEEVSTWSNPNIEIEQAQDNEDPELIMRKDNAEKITKDPIPIPLYNQYDYEETPYMGKTIAQRGCGITSASMIATYLLQDETLTPEYLAMTYGDLDNRHPDINYDSLMSVATSTLESLGIKLTLTYEFDDVMVALMEGKVVLSLENPGLFTIVPNGHFVVFTEITEECRFMVHDSNGYHWDEYEYYFENGFPYYSVYDTGSGYWICEVESTEQE